MRPLSFLPCALSLHALSLHALSLRGLTLRLLCLLSLLPPALLLPAADVRAQSTLVRTDLPASPGSVAFGESVVPLPNGDFLVIDPLFDDGKGAFYLYHGVTLALLGKATGVRADIQYEGAGIVPLPNGNIVVTSPSWQNDTGAVWLFDGVTLARISHLTGAQPGDLVGDDGVTVLANGNFVVKSKRWSRPLEGLTGATTWGHGERGFLGGAGVVSASNSLLDTGDVFGVEAAVVPLTNGNYVVVNPWWQRDEVINAGAVTWGNGTFGTTGIVSPANSLVGASEGDFIGQGGVLALSNGNYVVVSMGWDRDGLFDAGAVTWGDGEGGTVGAVSAANSLVGASVGDTVGGYLYSDFVVSQVQALTNGNYVVGSPNWDNGVVVDAGAVTWGDGVRGSVGVVGPHNSLVGSTTFDAIGGAGGVMTLPSGDYVVTSWMWDRGDFEDAGAVTWADGGGGGVKGYISAANSLVGSRTGDQVGLGGVVTLPNGDYLAISVDWRHSATGGSGAVTLGRSGAPVTGEISSANSLVGGAGCREVGSGGVRFLSNGNWLVVSPTCLGGAVTWRAAGSPTSGEVSAANSIVGITASERQGPAEVFPLTNGHYVISTPGYLPDGAIDDEGKLDPEADFGALTWVDGTQIATGEVGPAISLVGMHEFVRWENTSVIPLANGAWVHVNPYWYSDEGMGVGAVTWFDGVTPVGGVFDPVRSLRGAGKENFVGYSVRALPNGNYLVISPYWDTLRAENVGAITWGSGATGVAGIVSPANSLVGASAYDVIGEYAYVAANGAVVATSGQFDNGHVSNAGAITVLEGAGPLTGRLSEANSVLGRTVEAGQTLFSASSTVHDYIVVAIAGENRVVVFAPPRHMLSVTLAGDGVGTVIGKVPGRGTGNRSDILCGKQCSAPVYTGEQVELTAIAGAQSRFAGWSGACATGTTTVPVTEPVCIVTMDAANSLSATFVHDTTAANPIQHFPAGFGR